MKTLTEFAGATLQLALKTRAQVIEELKAARKSSTDLNKAAAEPQGEASLAIEDVPTSAEVQLSEVEAQPVAGEESVSEVAAIATPLEAPLAAPEEVHAATATPAEPTISEAPRKKTSEEYAAEREAIRLAREEERKKREAERAADREKKREELRLALSPKIAEQFKAEGEKLNHLLNCIEMVDRHKSQDLRRVIIFTLAENEAAPRFALKMGEFYYMAEYLAPLQRQAGGPRGRQGQRGRGRGRGGPRQDRGRGQGRGQGRGRDGGRGPEGGGGERGFGRGRPQGERGRGQSGRDRPSFPRVEQSGNPGERIVGPVPAAPKFSRDGRGDGRGRDRGRRRDRKQQPGRGGDQRPRRDFRPSVGNRPKPAGLVSQKQDEQNNTQPKPEQQSGDQHS